MNYFHSQLFKTRMKNAKMACNRTDPVIYSVLRFSKGDDKKIKIDSVPCAVPSARVEHVKFKTRIMINAGNKQPLWYLIFYFNLSGVCICQKKN